MHEFSVKHKLTKDEIAELRQCKYHPDGDMTYWKKMSEIYADEPEVLERIEFQIQYLVSLNAIPYEYPCHWKTQRCYLETVDDFNRQVGYVPEEKPEPQFKDCLLEEIAAKFGIDIDINGDGMTSFEKYRNGKIKNKSKEDA